MLGLAFEKQFAQCPTKHDLSSPSLCYSRPVEPDGQWRNEVLVNMCDVCHNVILGQMVCRMSKGEKEDLHVVN